MTTDTAKFGRNPTQADLNSMKSWAWRLRGREIDGQKLSAVQRRFWREALGVNEEKAA